MQSPDDLFSNPALYLSEPATTGASSTQPRTARAARTHLKAAPHVPGTPHNRVQPAKPTHAHKKSTGASSKTVGHPTAAKQHAAKHTATGGAKKPRARSAHPSTRHKGTGSRKGKLPPPPWQILPGPYGAIIDFKANETNARKQDAIWFAAHGLTPDTPTYTYFDPKYLVRTEDGGTQYLPPLSAYVDPKSAPPGTINDLSTKSHDSKTHKLGAITHAGLSIGTSSPPYKPPAPPAITPQQVRRHSASIRHVSGSKPATHHTGKLH